MEKEERERSKEDGRNEKREERKKKKTRKSHHKHRDSKPSNSRSRSRSRISSSPSQMHSHRKSNQQPKPKERHSQTQRQETPSLPRRNRINSHLLTHIISDHKKINRKLDAEEVQRAASKFKENFTSQIEPVTMSAYLSNEGLQKIVEAKQIGLNLTCRLCGESFLNGFEVGEHVRSAHAGEEE